MPELVCVAYVHYPNGDSDPCGRTIDATDILGRHIHGDPADARVNPDFGHAFAPEYTAPDEADGRAWCRHCGEGLYRRALGVGIWGAWQHAHGGVGHAPEPVSEQPPIEAVRAFADLRLPWRYSLLANTIYDAGNVSVAERIRDARTAEAIVAAMNRGTPDRP